MLAATFPLGKKVQRRGIARKVHPGSSPRWQLDRPDERPGLGWLPVLARKHTSQIRTEESPRFALLFPQRRDWGASFCRTRVWGKCTPVRRKGHACGPENGAAMIDGPILAGVGGLPAGATDEDDGRGRASFIVQKRAPWPQRGSIPADPTALVKEQAGSQACRPGTGGDGSPLTHLGTVVEIPGSVASMMPSVMI